MVPELLPGACVGTYSIRGLLGGTSWGQTHLATAPGKQVALKILDPLVAQQPGVLDEVRRVREALAGVPEHLVLASEDEGEDAETGARFLVSPFSEHPSLADLVEIFPMSAEESTLLMRNLATALEGAHGAGLAHLSLKPTNIFVGAPPTHTVRLGDFGSDALRRASVRVHETPGAVVWLAPEQLDVEGETPGSAASDVFAMALIAFFSMTGKPLWRAAEGSDSAALIEEVRGVRTKPSELAMELGADLPAFFDDALLRALAPAPADRFPSARAFADALASAFQSAAAIESARASAIASVSASAAAAAPSTSVGASPSTSAGAASSTSAGASSSTSAGASPSASAGASPSASAAASTSASAGASASATESDSPEATVPDQAAASSAPVVPVAPITPGMPGSAPASALSAPPPNTRHIKATAKLHRFDFPGADAMLQNPVARGTVRMPRFDGGGSEPVSSRGPAPAPAAPAINKTALLPRARIPVGPDGAPAMAPAMASGGGASSPAQGRPRFELPAASGGVASGGVANPAAPVARQDPRVVIAVSILLGFVAVAAVVTVIAVFVSRCSGASATGSASSTTPTGAVSAPVPVSGDLSPPSTAVSAPKASAASASDAELEVVCTPACERIFVDTKAMPSSPQPMRLSPGKHSVVVTKGGSASQTKQVTLRAGEKSTLTFTLTPSR